MNIEKSEWEYIIFATADQQVRLDIMSDVLLYNQVNMDTICKIETIASDIKQTYNKIEEILGQVEIRDHKQKGHIAPDGSVGK